MCISAEASASPIASWSVVLVVGTIPMGSASVRTPMSSTTSAFSASGELRFATIAMIFAPIFRRIGSRRTTSEVVPLLEMSTTGSPGWQMPKSP